MLRENALSTRLMTAALATAVLTVSSVAYAVELRVRCEVRDDRSKISVDGKDLDPGPYNATVTSGSNIANAGPEVTLGDDVEFDFDSDADDILDGATAIAAGFIQGAMVTGTTTTDMGVFVASSTVGCRSK